MYETIYEEGEEGFFTRYQGGQDRSENDVMVLDSLDWTGKTVLDVGCGTGRLAHAISERGARRVYGIDYSVAAIAKAQENWQGDNLTFEAAELFDWSKPVDVVVSCGTLEHFDDPGEALRKMIGIVPDGDVILTCPLFFNIRGFIWMAFSKLLDVPMSLTDKHFLSPFDIERFLEGTSHHLASHKSFDYEMANGRAMIGDMDKRMRHALADANLANDRVEEFMDWLRQAVVWFERTEYPDISGRNGLYHITPIIRALVPQSLRGKKAMFLLPHALHVRNFVYSGFLDICIDGGIMVSAVVPESLVDVVDGHFSGAATVLAMPPMSRRKLGIIENLRIGAIIPEQRHFEYSWRLSQLRKLTLGRRLLLGLWERLGEWFDVGNIARWMFDKLPGSRRARRLLSSVEPDVLVSPRIIGNNVDVDLLKEAGALGIPTLQGEGSWDNLTSKGPIWPSPDRLMVWGAFSQKCASEYHGLPHARIDVTGPLHFEVYREPEKLQPEKSWRKEHGISQNKKILFFAGTTIGKFSDERYVIEALSSAIDDGRLPNALIWYRPHPRMRSRAEHDGISNIPHVVIDPLEGAEQGLPHTWSMHENDDLQRANALRAADVIVTAFSTIIIDAALLGKPSVIVGFGNNDGVAKSNMFPSLKFRHVEHILMCRWISAATDEEKLIDQVTAHLSADSSIMFGDLRRFGASVAYCTGNGTSRRVLAAMLKTIDSTKILPAR